VGLAVKKQEVDLGELVLDLIDGFFKKIPRTDDDLGALVDGGLDRLDACSGGVLAGSVIGIGDFVGLGVLLDAVPGTFVEGLVIDTAGIGDLADFNFSL